MALEVASYVSQLDENWPLGTDKQDRGDDHIRLIKSVLLNTLAGPNGTGWEKAVTVSPDQLNAFNQRITDLENGLKNVYKVGDLMIRADNVNPATLIPGTTWTRLNGEFSMYLGNGSNGGTTTGSNTPAVPVPLHGHTVSVTVNSAGDHTHNVQTRVHGYALTAAGWSAPNGDVAGEDHRFQSTSGPIASTSGAHVHGVSASIGNTGVSGATIDVRGARMFFNVWKRVT